MAWKEEVHTDAVPTYETTRKGGLRYELEELTMQLDVLGKVVSELYERGDMVLAPPQPEVAPAEAKSEAVINSEAVNRIIDAKERVESYINRLNDFGSRLDI